MNTRTQRRIACTLSLLLLAAVQVMSEAWMKRETEHVPAEHESRNNPRLWEHQNSRSCSRCWSDNSAGTFVPLCTLTVPSEEHGQHK